MNIFSNLFSKTKDCKILLLGISNSGKTSLLYKLKLGQLVNTTHTIVYNFEEIANADGTLKFQIYDVGGIPNNWVHYFLIDIKAIMFMVDSTDKVSLNSAKHHLINNLLNRDQCPKDIALLVLANKQDLPGALSIGEIQNTLELYKIKMKWQIQAISVVNGLGLKESLDWVAYNISL